MTVSGEARDPLAHARLGRSMLRPYRGKRKKRTIFRLLPESAAPTGYFPVQLCGALKGVFFGELAHARLDAIAELQRAIELSGDRTSVYLGWLGHACAASGRKAEAEKILSELDELAKHGFLGSSHRAAIYAGLGEADKALQALRDARDQDDAAMIWLRVDPHYDSLRASPGFQELIKTQGKR